MLLYDIVKGGAVHPSPMDVELLAETPTYYRVLCKCHGNNHVLSKEFWKSVPWSKEEVKEKRGTFNEKKWADNFLNASFGQGYGATKPKLQEMLTEYTRRVYEIGHQDGLEDRSGKGGN